MSVPCIIFWRKFMKIDAYSEQKKAAAAYDEQQKRAAQIKGTVSGAAYTGSDIYEVGRKDGTVCGKLVCK